MRKYILIPDSFKGTMSSEEICLQMRDAILAFDPSADVRSIPVADGGEGSVDCFLAALGGTRKTVRVANPFFEDMEAAYGILHDGVTAVIEMAACAGLPLVEDRKDPCRATTYGVGQLMCEAVRQGAQKIILGLGGSATNDGGCGAAAAAGVRFYDDAGCAFIPVGGTLEKIAHINVSGLDPLIKAADIVAMCDINNPMFGPNGAAAIFGPQKGADEAAVRLLDDGLKKLANVMRTDLGRDVCDIAGAGAAGAMGAGMLAFFDAQMQMGIETVLDTVGFDSIVQNADMVFTGEGKIDGQSLRGKVVIGVARRAKKQRVPVIAIVGEIGEDIGPVYDQGVTAIFSINRAPMPLRYSRAHSKENLRLMMDNLMRLIIASI